jgi:two-component system cell cycle sensor histidine kinase/response regulator CckA
MRQRLDDYFYDESDVQSLYRQLREERAIKSRELQLVCKDGSLIKVVADIHGTFDRHGNLVELLGYLFDDSERKRLEAELDSAKRLQSVGALAGGAAHDFNNIITAISGYAALLLKQAEPGTLTHRSALAIQKAGDQASTLTRQLMEFSQKQLQDHQPFDMVLVLEQMRDMLLQLIGKDVGDRGNQGEVTTTLPDDLVPGRERDESFQAGSE